MNKQFNAVDIISGEKYYCPYCDPDQTRWKPAVLEPHWTIHRLHHAPKSNVGDKNDY